MREPKDRWILAGVLLLAALMRLARLGMAEFVHDEAHLSLLALDALDARVLPLLGMPSSVGFPNAPASVWLMMLPYAVSSNPLVATGFVALLNAAGVGLLYLLARRLYGREVGVVAALLYAVSPWAVLYSRKIWAQDMHTPFVLLALWLGVRGFLRDADADDADNADNNKAGRRVFQVMCLPVLVFALQMHYAAWVLLPVYGWLLWRGRVQWGAVGASVVLAALVLTPFALGIIQNETAGGGVTSSSVASRLLDDGEIALSSAALRLHGWLLTGAGFDDAIAPGRAGAIYGGLAPLRWVWLAWLGVAGLAGVFAAWQKNPPGAGLLALWLLPGVIAFTPTWTPVYPHYFIHSIPALLILAACGLVWLAGRIHRYAVYGLVGVVLVTQAAGWFAALDFGTRHAVEGGYGRPLRPLLDVRGALAPYEDVIVLSERQQDYVYIEPTTWAVLLHDKRCVRVIDGSGLQIAPNASSWAVLLTPDMPRPDVPLTVFPLREGEPGYAVFARERPPDVEPLPPLADVVRFENGVRLTGMALAGNILQLEWVLPGSQPGQNLQYFAHFMGADGERVAQRDGSFLPGRWWCDGDRLVTQIDVNAPPDAETMRAGLYALTPGGGFANVAVLDADGNPTGTWGSVPLATD